VFNKLISVISKPVDYFRGLYYIQSFKQNDGYMIIMLPGIGDTVFALLFIERFKKEHSNTNIKMVCCKTTKAVIDAYNGDYETILYDKDDKYIHAYLHIKSLVKIGEKHGLINTNPYMYYKRSNLNNSAIVLLSENAYKLKEKYNTNYRKSVQSLSNRNRDIILNPYSYSISHDNMIMYEKITKQLKQEGYRVLTNVVGEQKVIKGSERLSCSLEELRAFAENAAAIVSVRSGILDYIIDTGIPMFVLFENCTNRFIDIYTMKQWRNDETICEVRNNISNMTTMPSLVCGWLRHLYR